MKKHYIIQAFNVMNPKETGFMMFLHGEQKLIRVFKTRRAARKWLKKRREKITSGWIHSITAVYLMPKGGMI